MKLIFKQIFDMLVDIHSGIFLWMLMWGGAVIAWADHGETFLSILLFLSGIAWVYKNRPINKKGVVLK